MKSKAILLTAVLFFVAGVLTVYGQDRRNVDVSGFEGIALGGSGTVYVQQGSSFKVEFEGSDELFEEMKFEVRGRTLNIGRKNSSWWRSGSRGSYRVYITMPKLSGLTVSGSGEVEGQGAFRTDDLDLTVSGSGEIKLNTSSSDVEITISGSGEVELEGSANSIDARISGSGNVDGKDFIVKSAQASISGSGNMYIHATESIESRISGSGSIYYKGEPAKLNNNSSGSGKIRKMN